MRGKSKVLKVLLIMVLSGIFCAASLAVAPAGEVSASCGSKGWYFAEGYTGGDFDTWILLQNPNKTEAIVQLRFFTPNGEPIVTEASLAGETRYSLYLNTFPGLEKQEVATEVTVKYGDQDGIIAERAMYFNYNTGQGARAGGHSTIGADRLSTSWYLPEGYTGGGFDTYVLLMNPGDTDADVQLKLMKPQDGKYYTFKASVPAGRRKTVKLDDLVWVKGEENAIADAGAAGGEGGGEPAPPVKFDDTDVSTLIYSNKNIVAERAMYFDYYGKAGGSSSIGATGAAPEWYLPEGYTGGDFDTWVMAMNPNHYPVDITYTFYSNTPGFEPVPVTHFDVPPYSRDTIHVDEVEGLEGTDVSTKVTATKKVQLKAAGNEAANRYAVLYAVDDYGGDDLEYAKSGMYNLKHRLVDFCGYDYSRLRYRSDNGVTLNNLEKDMKWLADVAGPDDIVIFYFGGKSAGGLKVASVGAAALPTNYIKLFDGDVSQEQLATYFGSLQTQKLIAMLSCDNAGDFLGTLAGEGRIAMASCAAGENNHEYNDLKSDPFTYYMVEGLSKKAADTNGNDRVSAEEAFAYLQGRVVDYVNTNSGESQVPQISDGIAGEVDLTVDRVPANIVAERSVYFRYGGVSDGATSIGAPRTYPNWFLAEGYTGGSFDTFVLVMNPYDFWQKLTITYMTPSGVPIVEERDCPPRYRLTIKVDDVPGLEATDVSTRVSARPMDVAAAGGGGGVVVERAMYFTYTGPDGSRKAGGSCSIGYGTW